MARVLGTPVGTVATVRPGPAEIGQALLAAQPKRSSAESDADGGASAGWLAQEVLGRGPMSSRSTPWSWTASSPNQVRVSGVPFSVADWTYLPAREAPGASTVKLPPLP